MEPPVSRMASGGARPEEGTGGPAVEEVIMLGSSRIWRSGGGRWGDQEELEAPIMYPHARLMFGSSRTLVVLQ